MKKAKKRRAKVVRTTKGTKRRCPMERKRAGKQQQHESSKKQRIEEDKESDEVEEVSEDDEGERRYDVTLSVDKKPMEVQEILFNDKDASRNRYRYTLEVLWIDSKGKVYVIQGLKRNYERVLWRDLKVMFLNRLKK
ncbi:hypothetical protein Tco_0598642 [Tanacetum coccineum]